MNWRSFGLGRNYAWVVVVAMTLLLSSHGLMTSGLQVFDKSILGALDISHGALKLGDLIQTFAGGLWALAIGYMAEKVGPRAIIYAGLLLLSGVLVLYSEVTAVWQIYLLRLLLAFSYSSCHVVIIILVVTQWFATRKGVALGVILAGESLGGTIFPKVIAGLMTGEDWRATMRTTALIPLVLLLIMLLLLRRSPAAIGTTRVGEGEADPDGVAAPSLHALDSRSFQDYLRQPNAVLLFLAAGALFYAGGGFLYHTFLAFSDRGYAREDAATGLSLIFGAAFVGKLSSGYLADRLGAHPVWLGAQVVFLAGALAFTLGGPVVVWVAVATLGLGWGACYTVTQAIITERFAGPYLARLSGVSVLVEGIAAGFGIWLTGVFFDQFQHYTIPFLMLCGMLVVAFAAAWSMGRRLPRPAASTGFA